MEVVTWARDRRSTTLAFLRNAEGCILVEMEHHGILGIREGRGWQVAIREIWIC